MSKGPNNRKKSRQTLPVGAGQASWSHLHALEQLRSGSVVSLTVREWLIKVLQYWADHRTPLEPPRPQSEKKNPHLHVVWEYAERLPWIEAAEYMLALYNKYGNFESALVQALKWAEERYPDIKIKRTKLIEEYNEIKNLRGPFRAPEHFEGTETEEQAADYDAKVAQLMAEIAPIDPADLDEQRLSIRESRFKVTARQIGATYVRQVTPELSPILAKQLWDTLGRHRMDAAEALTVQELAEHFVQGLLEQLASDMPKALQDSLNDLVKTDFGSET